MTIQPARHECRACCLLRAGFPAFQPVVDNTRGTRVEQVVSSFQKILRGLQLTWYVKSACIDTHMRMYVCACTYAHVFMRMYVCICMCTCLHECIYACVHFVHLYMCACIIMLACMYAHMYVYLCTFMHVRLCVYVCIDVCYCS